MSIKKEMEGLEEQVKFAAAIGCSRMMVVIPPATPMPKSELRKTLKERFTAVGSVLSKYNLRCGLEFLGPLYFRRQAPHVFIYQMGEMVDFAKECGPSFGVVLDVWHWYHSGSTLEDIRRTGNSGIVLVHLSDAAKMPPEDVRDNARLMAGGHRSDGHFQNAEGDRLGRQCESRAAGADSERDVGGGRSEVGAGDRPGCHAQGGDRRLIKRIGSLTGR
jgi:sugar phosphate isomerase/epimerase